MSKRKRNSLVMSVLLAILLLTSSVVLAQGNSSQAAAPPAASIDQDIALLRKDLRSQRKQIIAANMNLTGDEAEKFWPIYEQYVNDLVQTNHTKYDLIKQYVQNSGTLTADQADGSVKKWLAVDESVTQLRMKYFPTFRKVLSAQKTALFYQLDRRVQLMIDLQLASQLPLIEP
ncbi:MAG TPA: hypothetical protein VMT20_02630 [Terriglobia bacterium]|nr:hypothetical protein [Terriglobia bacterium]